MNDLELVFAPAAAGLLLWARRAGDIDRLLQRRRANAGSATTAGLMWMLLMLRR